jgi:hypothetical protein
MFKQVCAGVSLILILGLGSCEKIERPVSYWSKPYEQPKSFRDKVVEKTLKHNRQPKVMKRYALSLVRANGWGYSEFLCLDALWTKESNWRWNALNKHSGAYGIPQAYPASKLASAGADWRSNPFTQIRWGIDYIKRSGHRTPCSAWRHSETHNSY